MKLNELFPDPPDALDPMAMADDTDAAGIEAPTGRPRAFRDPEGNGTNRKRAKTIKRLARMKARAANSIPDERSHQYNQGGHHGINWR